MKKIFTILILLFSAIILMAASEKNKTYVREGSSSYDKILYAIDNMFVREGSCSQGFFLNCRTDVIKVYWITDGIRDKFASMVLQVLQNVFSW